MRAAHLPFNSPIEYRNKSDVGIVGDNVMEMDDMVGNIFKQLEKSRIKVVLEEVFVGKNKPLFKDDTIVIFMSDNGADLAKKNVYHMYNHDQASFGTILQTILCIFIPNTVENILHNRNKTSRENIGH